MNIQRYIVHYVLISLLIFALLILLNEWKSIKNTGHIVKRTGFSFLGLQNVHVDITSVFIESRHHLHKPANCTESGQSINKIPAFMYDVIDSILKESNNSITLYKTCKYQKPKNNFVYIKNHKCASDTLSSVFRRYAYDRNLSVVLPTHFLLGWPHALKWYMHKPKKTTNFNVLLDHVVYNHSYLSEIMHDDTVYFSSLREPGDRLMTAVVYFAIGECALMPADVKKDRVNSTVEFLNHMDYYNNMYLSIENLYSKEKCGCIPNGVSMVKNAMAFDLGFPVGYHVGTVDQSQNYEFIMKWLKEIYDQMPFMILFEYFDYSMVLLKRYMCWSMKDVIYRHLNHWNNPVVQFDKQKMGAYRHWTNVDTLLYNLYNKSLWITIENLGEDFQQEAKEYNIQLEKVTEFCNRNKMSKYQIDNLTISETKWNIPYTISEIDCLAIVDDGSLRKSVQGYYDSLPGLNHLSKKLDEEGYLWC